MIAGALDYRLPETVREATEQLAVEPRDTCVIGGGTWVVPWLASGERTAGRVVDLRRVAELRAIRATDDGVLLGATVTYSDLVRGDTSAGPLRLLALMARGVTGGVQIRNQGTLGGSFVAARPSSDAPTALVALDARAVVRGPGGERRLAAVELLAGAMRSALAPAELLTGFELPLQQDGGIGYVKLKRGASSWPLVTAATRLELDSSGRLEAVRLVVGGATATPLVIDVSTVLGSQGDVAVLAEVERRTSAAVVEPYADVLADGSYRAAVAPVVARRAVAMALADARRDRSGERR